MLDIATELVVDAIDKPSAMANVTLVRYAKFHSELATPASGFVIRVSGIHGFGVTTPRLTGHLLLI